MIVASRRGKGMEPRTILIQGLTGMGLVGYNVARAFLSAFKDDAIRIESYPDFFPRISTVDNGKLSGQNIEVHRIPLENGKTLLILNGDQPPEIVLSSMFMSRFLSDLNRWHLATPIDLFLSFGASFSSFTIQSKKEDEKNPNNIVKTALDLELNMKRKIFLSVCGGIEFEGIEVLTDPTEVYSIEKGQEGFITGLNGVLPSCVGDRCNIPASTVMIQAQIPEFAGSETPLYQLCGLCASRVGLIWLSDLLDLDKTTVVKQIEDTIERLIKPSSDQLLQMITGSHPEEKRVKEPTSHMYV